jgi:hypothetical protein
MEEQQGEQVTGNEEWVGNKQIKTGSENVRRK